MYLTRALVDDGVLGMEWNVLYAQRLRSGRNPGVVGC